MSATPATHPIARPNTRLAAIAAVLLPSLVTGCTGAPTPGPGTLASNDDPGYSAHDAQIIETGADGKPRYILRAGLIRQDPATGSVALEAVDMTVSQPQDPPWRVRSAQGRLPQDARSVVLEGSVLLEGEAAPGQGTLRIRTERLDYDLTAGRVTVPDAVRLEMAGRTLEAVGLEADLNRREAQLLSKVHGRFQP
jgi:LPS export ABC transporter protein LptC